MEATILNTDFEPIGIIDTYKSFIWTDRYDEAGDFEIHIPLANGIPEGIKKDHYLWNENSEHIMIIESLTIESDIESGATLIVSGRSLESILDRRIVWDKCIFYRKTADDSKPNLQNGIETLLTKNLIDPEIEIRTIPNFIFEESTDERIISLTFEDQFLGEDLYSVVKKLCQEEELGFKVTLNDANQLVFKLYKGIDRSYEQTENPYVIFSPEYNNILNSNYLDSYSKWKNVTLVVGEQELNDDGEEVSRIQYVQEQNAVDGKPYSGLDRREIFTDATSLSQDDGYGGKLSAEAYQAHLRKKGIDTLIDNTIITAFEGEIDATNTFVYGKDFFVGDIVEITDEYGNEGRSYVSELIISCDESGTSIYPTFKAIQKGVYET